MPSALNNKIEGVLSEHSFDGFSDWFIKFNNPVTLWELQPTYILAQISFLVGAFITLCHALKNGGRLPYLWIATVLHGLVVEAASYNLEDIDNFWHSQTPVVLMGRRLPIHIIALYPVFLYHASVAVSRMKLSTYAEPFAVGLLVVLVDIPYDIVSVKFVHWTWHDTDPNIKDRHYWVPWNSYYFHASFAASFTFWFHFWNRRISQKSIGTPQENGFCKQMTCAVLTALLGMPGGVLLFLPLYHPLHDIYHIHSEVTFMILFAMFLLIIWTADRRPKTNISKEDPGSKWRLPLFGHLIVHYGLFLSMVLFGNPEKEVSIGLHETIGPCNETVSLQTAFGSVLQKRKYLCLSDYDEDYFDFKCLSSKDVLRPGMNWYKVCGTPFENRAEYISVITTICIIAFVVFRNLYSNQFTKSSQKGKKE
ncbi:hypothetical protein R5R35_013754 [Gryllus longicercus]|uniref:DUF7802 domain-containing protein n=1 Tax=Gryllus longicercus TaxID=2509291 RepID=A0AAN9W0Q6_9ORTH